MSPSEIGELVRELLVMIARRDVSQREAAEAGLHVERILATLQDHAPQLLLALRVPQRGNPTRRSAGGWLTQTDFASLIGASRRCVLKAIAAGQISAPAVDAQRMIDPDAALLQLEATSNPANPGLVHKAKLKAAAMRAEGRLPPLNGIVFVQETSFSTPAEPGREAIVDHGETVAPVVEELPADPDPGEQLDTFLPSIGDEIVEVDQIPAPAPELVQSEPEPPQALVEEVGEIEAVAPIRPAPVVEKPKLIARDEQPDDSGFDRLPGDDREPKRAKARLPILGSINGGEQPPAPKPHDPLIDDIRSIPAATYVPGSAAMTIGKAVTLLRTRGYEVVPIGKKGAFKLSGRIQTEEEVIQRIEGILEREERTAARRPQSGARA